jgi:predicted MFS family arabinose efflux permease
MAVAVQNVAPALAGVLHLSLGWNDREIGAFASADSLGTFAGNLLAATLMLRSSFRTLTLVGMSLLALSDLASGLTSSAPLLVGERVIGGVGGGLALAISFSVFAASHPERGIATWSVGQLVFGLIGITALPMLAAAFGWRAAFFCLAVLTVAAFALLRFLPGTSAARSATGPSGEHHRIEGQSAIGILGVGLFYFGQGCLWPFLELIGIRSGIALGSVESSLSLSAVSALLGSVLVLTAGNRFGRKLPLLASFAVTLAALFSIGVRDPLIFRLALAAFTFAWPVFGAYQFAVIAANNRSPRLGAFITAATFAGTMLGPLVAGVISDRAGFGGVMWLAVTMDSIALGCLVPLLRRATP